MAKLPMVIRRNYSYGGTPGSWLYSDYKSSCVKTSNSIIFLVSLTHHRIFSLVTESQLLQCKSESLVGHGMSHNGQNNTHYTAIVHEQQCQVSPLPKWKWKVELLACVCNRTSGLSLSTVATGWLVNPSGWRYTVSWQCIFRHWQ